MIEFTLFEKIKMLFNLIVSSPLFLILVFGLILMFVDIKFISKRDKKTKITYIILSIVIIILLLQSYFNSLLDIFDTINTNIVSLIYFPSVLEYMVIILTSLGVLIYSILNKKINSKIKIVNILVFIINIFIFFLILDQISSNNIDLSNKISIYTNDNLMILFELSIAIFIAWIIGLILYKIINYLIHRNDIDSTPVNLNTNNFYDEPSLPQTMEELRSKNYVQEPRIEYVVVEKKKENDLFTLDEYRQMRAILEVIKENQKKAKN